MSTKEVTAPAVRPTLPEKIERALVEGDLSSLNAQERVQFYNAKCESLGLNPLTLPFGYIMLNGKLTLYALKACTDQLRQVHGVSIGQLREQIADGLYIVFAPATDRNGRTDEDMGAVSLGKLTGEALANAKMKAVTKAKRRVTLSICGLGMLDETEVEAIPGAKPEIRRPAPVSQIVLAGVSADKTADAAPVEQREPGEDDAPPTPEELAAAFVDDNVPPKYPGCITRKQVALLMATAREGRGEQALRDKLDSQFGWEHLDEVKAEVFDAVLAWTRQKPQVERSKARVVRR